MGTELEIKGYSRYGIKGETDIGFPWVTPPQIVIQYQVFSRGTKCIQVYDMNYCICIYLKICTYMGTHIYIS